MRHFDMIVIRANNTAMQVDLYSIQFSVDYPLIANHSPTSTSVPQPSCQTKERRKNGKRLERKKEGETVEKKEEREEEG